MITSVTVDLHDEAGAVSGQLTIACLPRGDSKGPALILDRRDDPPEALIAQAAVQLLEEAEYTFDVDVEGSPITVDPEDLFNRSDVDGKSGRLRPGRSTGTVSVKVRDGDRRLIGHCQLEVRSKKLNYVSEYRWMLQRIADEAAEVAQSSFAASSLGAFRPANAGSAEGLYQRFAFIQSLLAADDFRASLQMILHRPHRDYVAVERHLDPSRGIRPGRRLARELVKPGPRQPFPNPPAGLPLASLPQTVPQIQHEETFDTLPNRFVKFALEEWRNLAEDVGRCSRSLKGPAAVRGAQEAGTLADELTAVLADRMFADVGQLQGLPVGNPVLERRAGYRDVLRAFFQADAAALVDWSAAEDLFSAGQRNVASLYEYWVYLELARIVGSLSGFGLDRRPVLKKTKDGLSLDLRRGHPSVLHGEGRRRGRLVSLDLWFNQQFSPGHGSWTEPVQPDCSLRIAPSGGGSTWLHFDAKYRLSSSTDLFGRPPDNGGTAPAGSVAAPLSEDVLKMHAYRDAIHRTSGAFVLYPGLDEEARKYPKYHEILPGLGAFVLRPTESGRAQDTSAHALRQFIEDVIDHVAASGTDQERADYWNDLTYRERRGTRLPPEAWLGLPAADTAVLLGFVKNTAHWSWIERTGTYNLRADERRGSVRLTSPELSTELLCLYDTDSEEVALYRLQGSFLLRSADQLLAEGYPDPRGNLYCCLVLGGPLLEAANTISADRVRALARMDREPEEWAAPRRVSWQELPEPLDR